MTYSTLVVLPVILAGTKELMHFSAMTTDLRPPELERPVLPRPLVMYKRNPFENDLANGTKSGVPLILQNVLDRATGVYGPRIVP